MNAISKRFEVAEIALLQPVQSSDDCRLSLQITEFAEPIGNQVFAIARDVMPDLEHTDDFRLKTKLLQVFSDPHQGNRSHSAADFDVSTGRDRADHEECAKYETLDHGRSFGTVSRNQ